MSLRTRSRNASLLGDHGSDFMLEEGDIRLEDYLNDKIQITTDFDNLDGLLVSVETQKQQLEEQLQDARTKLAAAKRASAEHVLLVKKQTEDFQQQQNDLQRRLMIVTSSDQHDEAVQRLKGPIEKLRRVNLARQYVDLLQHVSTLVAEARNSLPDNPKEALKPYTKLKELAISLRQKLENTEGAGEHVVLHVESTVASLWTQMQSIMSNEFEAVLERLHWPSTAVQPTQEWVEGFGKLLDLQTPEIMTAREPLVLLPIHVLGKIFRQNFRYQFMGTNTTSSVERLGDLFFDWFLGTVSNHEHYLRENVGPVLAAHFQDTALANNSLYLDPISAFITALLPVLKQKVDDQVAATAQRPEFLSRFMFQLMAFDEDVRTKFQYDAGNAEYGWKGLTWEVMDTWFERWEKVEKDFAIERYEQIIKAQNSGSIDFDSNGQGKTKSTFGAAQVTYLIETVTEQYNKLRKFSHKLRFLVEIQAEIVDQYHGRLRDSLDVYQTITSPVGRTLHGFTREQQAALEGIGGLESLCKVFGSAEHLISKLKQWSNEEFFVDMWDQLQDRAKNTHNSGNLAGSMSYTAVKESTSAAVGSEDEGSVFDVTIDGFERLRGRAEGLIIQALKYAFPSEFRQYLTKPQWTTVDDSMNKSDASTFTVSPGLEQPLQTLRENMAFLHKTLAYPPFRRIWRECLDSLQDLLWNEILMKQDFTTLGASRLLQDLAAIQDVVSSCVTYGNGFGMPKLKEGVEFLNLPLEVTDGDGLSLAQATELIFSSNAGAAEVLEKLKMSYITNSQARAILQRRVEAST